MSQQDKPMECPFTWEIKEELSTVYDENSELPVSVEDQPVIAMMNCLTSMYSLTMKKDYEKAVEKLTEVEKLRESMNDEILINEHVSVKVFDHIISATNYYVCKIVGKKTMSNNSLRCLPDHAADFKRNPLDIATVHGCKAIVWSNFHKMAYLEAINDAKAAADIIDECPLWHFLLYKNYWRKRTVENVDARPSELERNALYKCTTLSKRPYYWIYRAKMYRDDGEDCLARAAYNAVFEATPKSTETLLRLANGLMKYREMDRAKVCLDVLQVQNPENSMFLYQKGEYLCAVKEPKNAARHFKAAADATGMYKAYIRYVSCKIKADRNFDHFEFLCDLISKYEDDKNNKQNLLLHLAFEYMRNNEFSKFCERIVEAIELDPQNQQLKEFRNMIRLASANSPKKIFNIFDYVKKFIPEAKDKNIDPAMLQKLEELCQ